MNVTQKEQPVKKLVKAFEAGSLLRNAEYQRGEAWKELQKAKFIDSLFRGYPVPAFFLHVKEDIGLDDTPTKKYEIIDGQQRLISLRDFKIGRFKLLEVADKSKLRLPKSVQKKPAPWAGKSYNDLPSELQEKFDNFKLTIFEVGQDAESDEIRDLFIRLQSGTALTRQQIRDAWPGALGPYLEKIAGKLDKKPSCPLFGLIDKRGQRIDEEERDEYVNDRQLAAQLLKIFITRERDPSDYASVSASELDGLYHELTDWDEKSPTAARFIIVLTITGLIIELYIRQRVNKAKFKRLDVTVLVMYIQDITRLSNAKITDAFISGVAKSFADRIDEDRPSGGQSSSPALLKKYYEWWRSKSPDDTVIRLDPNRLFGDEQKKIVAKRQEGKCAICNRAVIDGDAEYDHFPIPFRDGGVTQIDNCRLVHASCHPRGRPLES